MEKTAGHTLSLGHLTLPTQHVDRTVEFFEQTLGCTRDPVPANVPDQTVWLNIGRGQSMHVFFVKDFAVSPFEGEFGRHVALFYELSEFPALKQRLEVRGAVLFDAERATPFERFFFREPVNGYVLEVIDRTRANLAGTP